MNRAVFSFATIAAALCLAPVSSAKPTATVAKLPNMVREEISNALSDGGPQPLIPQDMARAVDVNHDGTPDWLIDYAKAGETIWCGTGGCRYQLFVSDETGSYVVAFDETARSFDIRRNGRVDVSIYGTYCGSFGADDCRRSFAWSAQDKILLPVLSPTQHPWLFGPLFSPVLIDRNAWPTAVASAVATRVADCEAAGGTLDEADGAIVRAPDLDGDHRPDWIIGSPFSACVTFADAPGETEGDLPRPTLTVVSGAKGSTGVLFIGPDANYVVDLNTEPATVKIVPGEEERLQRCADRPIRCGGTSLRWDPAERRLTASPISAR